MKELAQPSVLRDRREASVEEELQGKVVGADGERPCPDVGPPMSHGLDEADELALVSRELG